MHKIICIQICRGAARISNYMLKWWRAQLIIYLFWNKTYTAIVPHRRSPSVARSRLSTLVIHSGPPNVNSISFSFSWGDYNEWWEIVLLLREALHDERWEYIQHISNRSGDFFFFHESTLGYMKSHPPWPSLAMVLSTATWDFKSHVAEEDSRDGSGRVLGFACKFERNPISWRKELNHSDRQDRWKWSCRQVHAS